MLKILESNLLFQFATYYTPHLILARTTLSFIRILLKIVPNYILLLSQCDINPLVEQATV